MTPLILPPYESATLQRLKDHVDGKHLLDDQAFSEAMDVITSWGKTKYREEHGDRPSRLEYLLNAFNNPTNEVKKAALQRAKVASFRRARNRLN